jgi:hypothetical protein
VPLLDRRGWGWSINVTFPPCHCEEHGRSHEIDHDVAISTLGTGAALLPFSQIPHESSLPEGWLPI